MTRAKFAAIDPKRGKSETRAALFLLKCVHHLRILWYSRYQHHRRIDERYRLPLLPLLLLPFIRREKS